MSNFCYYNMKIVGKRSKVLEFVDAMNKEGKYERAAVGRIFGFSIFEEGYDENGKYYVIGEGDCAWSIKDAMLNLDLEDNIKELSKKLNLKLEAYSEEIGWNFQEHLYIDNGQIRQYECVDFHEVCIDNIDDDLWTEPWIISNNITPHNYEENVEDEYLRVGGFPVWDWKCA